MPSCDKIETIIVYLKITGAKGDLCPSSIFYEYQGKCPGGVGAYGLHYTK